MTIEASRSVDSIVCLAGWIIMLYIKRHQEEKGWENQFLTRYSAVLNDMAWHLRQFEELETFEDQLSGLESITNDIIQLKSYMEMHIGLMGLSMPEETINSEVDSSGWHEAETVIGLINNGGVVNFDPVESFRADGVISEAEAGVICFLKEETDQLCGNLRVFEEDGVNYEYMMSSLEVYQHITEMMQKTKQKLVQINRD